MLEKVSLQTKNFKIFRGGMPPEPPRSSALWASSQPCGLKFSCLKLLLGCLTKKLLRTLFTGKTVMSLVFQNLVPVKPHK